MRNPAIAVWTCQRQGVELIFDRHQLPALYSIFIALVLNALVELLAEGGELLL